MKNETVQLLLVDISVAEVIVECPQYEAVAGALVEFTYGNRDVIGTVTDSIRISTHSEEYRFMTAADVIFRAKNIWNHTWTSENQVP